MKKGSWGLEIRKVENGFVIKDSEGSETIAEETRDGELSAAEDLLNQVIEFFGLRGSRYDRERIRVVKEVGDKYEPLKDEEIVGEHYQKIARRQVKKNRQK